MSTRVCVHHWQKPNKFIPSKELINETATKIKNRLNIQNENLLISTPLYRKLLEPMAVPLTEYKQLILVESKSLHDYPPTDFNLTVLPKSYTNTNFLTLSIKTQFTEHVFPNMRVEYDPNRCKTVSDLIDLASKLFDIGCENAKIILKVNENETDLSSNYSVSEMLDLSINQIKSNLQIPLFTFSCKIPDDTLSSISKRCQIASEIISSEESFVADIFQLDQFYKKRIYDSKIFDDFQLKFIFRDIPNIVVTHKHILGDLKRITVNYASEFGSIFLNYIKRFTISLSFIANYDKVDCLIREKLTRPDALAKFQAIEDENETGKSFMSYYITPVQRYPRYPLLIRDLIKYTPNFHPDKPYLIKALDSINNSNKILDDNTHKMKSAFEIEKMEEATGCKNIADNDRFFIIKQPVKITKPKNQSGILYLFTDIIILVIKNKKGLSIVLSENKDEFLQVNKFQFYNDRPTPDSIIAFIFQKEYVFTFESYSQKCTWMDSFNKIRENLLSNIKDKNKFAKWADIEIGEQIYPLTGHDGVIYKKKAYFIGGLNQNNSNNQNIIIYDIDKDKWSSESASSLPPRSSHTAVTYKGYIYVLFGQGSRNALGDIWRYQGNDWTKVAAPTTYQRYGHTIIIYNDLFYIFGGRNNEKILNDVLIFDPEKNEFKHVEPAQGSKTPSGRYYHSAALYQDKMIIYGGKTGKGVSSDIYSFNLTTNKWSQVDLKLKPRFGHKLVVLSENYLFIIGGFVKNGVPSNTVVISLEDVKILTDFTEYGNTPFCISKFALVQLTEERALVYGGIDATSKVPFSSAYILDTEEGFDSNREYDEVLSKPKERIIYSLGSTANDSDSELNALEARPRMPNRSTTDLIDSDKKKMEEDQKFSRNTVQLGTHSQNDITSQLQGNKLFKEKDKKKNLTLDSEDDTLSHTDLSRHASQKNIAVSRSKSHASRKKTVAQGRVDDSELSDITKKSLDPQDIGRKRANTFMNLPVYANLKDSETPSSDKDTDKNDETDKSNGSEKIEETKKEEEESEQTVETKKEEESEQTVETKKEEEPVKIVETKKEEEEPVKIAETKKEKVVEPEKIPEKELETPKVEKKEYIINKTPISTPIRPELTPVRSITSTISPKSDPQMPVLRSIQRQSPVSTIIKSDFVPDPDLKLSSTFNENEFYRKFCIDVSQLSLIQRQQMLMKAKNAYKLFIENEGLENQIKTLNKEGSLVLKITDASRKTHILLFSDEDNFEIILQKINKVLGKEALIENLTISLPNETATSLSEQSFEEKKQKMIVDNLSFMKVSEN